MPEVLLNDSKEPTGDDHAIWRFQCWPLCCGGAGRRHDRQESGDEPALGQTSEPRTAERLRHDRYYTKHFVDINAVRGLNKRCHRGPRHWRHATVGASACSFQAGSIHPGDALGALGRQLRQLATRVDQAYEELDPATRAMAVADVAR